MAELRRRLPTHISKIYYPVDRRKYVRRALAVINPEGHRAGRGGNLAEFLWRARDLKSRFSGQRAAVRPFVSALQAVRISVPAAVRVVCRRRLPERGGRRAIARVGCRPEAVQVVGNLKFDAAKLDERRTLDVPAMLRQLGVPADAPILVAAARMTARKLILAEMAHGGCAKFPKLFLVLVPRHFERCRKSANNCARAA
jgi:3-deoxy-D-manno-octulosonic-acid transferase